MICVKDNVLLYKTMLNYELAVLIYLVLAISLQIQYQIRYCSYIFLKTNYLNVRLTNFAQSYQ